MALADLTAYKAAVSSPSQVMQITKALNQASASSTGLLHSQWTRAQDAGAAPSTAAVPTNATTGAIGQQDGGSGQLFIAAAEATALPGQAANSRPDTGVVILADRLSHQGGLDGTSTSAQTTNLPTAALTRYTDGAGVWAALEVYTALGTTSTTVTASYTNTGATSGRTTQAVAIGAAAIRQPQTMVMLPLQSGDTGVKSVESVTLAASTTSVGNFGVTLFKPLLFMPMGLNDEYQYDVVRGTLGGGLPEIVDTACLFWIWASGGGSAGTAGQLQAALNFAEY